MNKPGIRFRVTAKIAKLHPPMNAAEAYAYTAACLAFACWPAPIQLPLLDRVKHTKGLRSGPLYPEFLFVHTIDRNAH